MPEAAGVSKFQFGAAPAVAVTAAANTVDESQGGKRKREQ